MKKECQGVIMEKNSSSRLLSLDALRGFDMLWIMGLSTVLLQFAGGYLGGKESWLWVQMRHSHGPGFTFYDLIFPLFLFMAGASYPFSHASMVRRGVSVGQMHWRILKRVLVLCAIQIVQSGALWFDPAKYHYPSVLVRIAVPWAFAALLYIHTGFKTRFWTAIGILVGYETLLAFVNGWPLLDGLDKVMSIRAWCGHDPFEVHDIPLCFFSLPLALAGMFAGDLVRSTARTPSRKAFLLAVVGAGLTAAGLAVDFLGTPIEKNLSTPAFMLLTGGLCHLLFAAFYYVIDVKGFATWTWPLRIIGTNSIVAYLLPGILDFGKTSKFFLGGVASLFPNGDFVLAFGNLLCCFAVLWLLDRAKIYLKA